MFRFLASHVARYALAAAMTTALLAGDQRVLAAQQPAIDTRSYRLGGIGAFAELVGAGVKKLALSAVMTSSEVDALIAEAEVIVKRNHALLYRESDLIVTDLFPPDVAAGKQVLVIYAGTTLDEYQALKRDRARLMASGEYTGAAREEIARRFGRLLSYPEWKIDQLLKEAR